MSSQLPYLPPEWAPQTAIWAGWPHLRGEWGPAFDGARTEITYFLKRLAQVTDVKIACGSREAYGSAWFTFASEISAGRVTLYTLPAGDIWVRDTGPLFAEIDQTLTALEFQFNGWGNKYSMAGDLYTAGGIASAEARPRRRHNFVLEGGAIDWDGAGRLLTTKACLLNPNRMPGWDHDIATSALQTALGVSDIIWLDEGLKNDHTDGHVDNIARFIGPGRVICQSPSGDQDPNAHLYEAVATALDAANLDVVRLPSPGRICGPDDTALPASHVNFLISNKHVFLPIYEAAYSGQAIDELAKALPDYTIVPIPSRHILDGGGALHCMTQQVPNLEGVEPCPEP